MVVVVVMMIAAQKQCFEYVRPLLIIESKKGLCAVSERYAVDLVPFKTICFSEGIPCFDQQVTMNKNIAVV